MKFLILWKENGQQWQVLPEQDIEEFLKNLIEDRNVDPATIIAIPGTSEAHWLFPSCHNGQRMFLIKNIDKPVTPVSPMKRQQGQDRHEIQEHLGWIAPDGRYFQCGYGGHSALATQIVGSLTPIDDASKYLEDHGWAAVFRNPLGGKRYMVGMGKGWQMNDKQAQTLLKTIPVEQIESFI